MDLRRPPTLAYAKYVDELASDVAVFVQALQATAAEAPVPSCPAWSLRELATHAGDFAAFYTHAICDGTGAPRPPWANTWRHGGGSPLGGSDPDAYFGVRAEFLLRLLRETSPAASVRTWDPADQTAHFVARRPAHEVAGAPL